MIIQFVSDEAYLAFNTSLAVVGAAAGITALILSILLLKKYSINKSQAILYLGLAFLLFAVGIVSALPIFIFVELALIKFTYAIAKTLGVLAVSCYLKFSIEIFYPREKKNVIFRWIQVIFFILNETLLLVHYILEINHILMTGLPLIPPTIIVIQEIIMSIPFLGMFILAYKIAKKSSVQKDKFALHLIGISGLLNFGSYFLFALNDLVVKMNYFPLVGWILALIGFILFYIGVARPKMFFKKYD
ncbi:MAG: hypothetical protein ACFFCS_21800 [Candidatus Hodarchaeota archaeon]